MLQAGLFRFLIDRRTRLMVSLVVLALLAHQLSLLFWQLFPSAPETVPRDTGTVIRQNAQSVERPGKSEKAEQINRALLFGQPQAIKEAVTTTVEEAPETTLNYKLRGIYFSDQPTLAAAIIELSPNQSRYFSIGDEIAENILLSDIARDFVLINRYGKIERLNLEKPTVSTAGQPETNTGGNAIASSSLLRSYKKRYIGNPLALARRFQAIPVQENGRNIGFRLKALRGESLLQKLSFEENDVFIRVNGIELDKPFQALDALKSLTTASSVSVTILRNGSEQTMDFSL